MYSTTYRDKKYCSKCIKEIVFKIKHVMVPYTKDFLKHSHLFKYLPINKKYIRFKVIQDEIKECEKYKYFQKTKIWYKDV